MTDRTITITPGDQPGHHHTDPTGTIAHTGPVAGCTLPGCEQTPDTDPQARRKHLADLVLRMRRGELHPQGRDILAAVIKDELAYGDQAREQLAAADRVAERTATRHGRHHHAIAEALGCRPDADWDTLVTQAATVRAAAMERADLLTEARDALEQAGQTGPHGDDWPTITPAIRALAEARDLHATQLDTCRGHVSEALGLGTGAPWDAIVERAQAARRGEAEAVRAREAAEAGERRAMEQRQQMAAKRYAWQERGDRAEISTRAHKTAATEALERADLAEQALHRVQGDWRRAYRAWQNARRRARELATLHDVRTQEAKGWHARAEKAERDAKRAERRCEDLRAESLRRGKEKLKHAESARAATARAERAEATLTAVRALLPDDPRDDKWTDHVTATAVRAALGDPHPATEPTPAVCCVCGCPDVTYRNCNDQPFCCRCAMCCDPPKLCTHGCQQPAAPALITTLPGGIRPAQQPPEFTLIGATMPVHVTPQQVADAVRRILREDHAQLRDLLR